MQVYFLNNLPERGYPLSIYYVKADGKYYGWDGQNNRFYNLSTPNIDDLVGLSFENLQEGDVLSYDSVSQTWINKVINTSTGVNSFNERQGDVYLLSSDVTDALEYTPENLANKQNDLTPSSIKYPTVDAVNTGLSGKQDSLGYTPENVLNKQNNLTSSTTNYPTVDAVNAGLLTKEPAITSGTSSEYWRGDKTFQTLDKNAIGLNNVDNTSDADKPISTLQATAIGLKEDSSNKSTSTTDSASTTKFPVWSAIVSYFDISRIKTILGITTLSGSNTGDQDLSGLVTKTTTINSQALSSNITLTTSDITDSTNKRYVTDTNLSTIGNQSGINTGDETITSIKTKLGITTLSGSNTGDQDLSNLVVKNNDISAATKTKITYDTKGLVTNGADATTADITESPNKRYVTDSQLSVIGNTSGINTGDQDLTGLVVKNTAIVGDTKTKITYDAKGLVTSGEDATTADIADTLNKRYITDAQLIVVSNTSGTNTGDNATNSQYSGLAASKQDVLGFTPENLANKSTNVNTDQTSDTKYPSVKSVYDWATIVFTTTSAVATQITTALVGYATQSWVNSQGFITSVIGSLGYTPENEANKENTILDTSTVKYPTNNLVKTAVDSKVTANANIPGDTKTKITYDSQGLITSSTDATTEDIVDSFDKRYVTDDNLLVINNTSGVNTGDQTLSGLGGVPTSRNITVNGTILNLSADSTFTVTDANLSTSDITTNNVSTTKHGFAPKLANNTTQFLRADGSWASPNVSLSVQSVASSATVTPTSDNNIVVITAQAAALTMAIPTGTPVQGQALMIRIKDNGTARAITWTTGTGGYRAIGITLPTTTVINKTTYVGLIYNSTDSRWDAIGVATEA